MGMVGTYALAGSAREDSVDRLQRSVDVLHAIMSTPDKGIPEEVLSNAKCILVVPDLIKGGFIFGGKHGRGVATCRTAAGLERARICLSWRRKLGIADRSRRRRPGHAGHERPGLAASAFQQVRTHRRRIRRSRPGWPSCLRRNGLEDEHRNADLLALERRVRRLDAWKVQSWSRTTTRLTRSTAST